MIQTIRKSKNRGHTLGIALGILIIAFMLVGYAGAAHPAGNQSHQGKGAAANEVLVKFQDSATPIDIGKAKVKEDVDETERIGSTGVLRFHSKSKNVDTLISDLSAEADVQYVEPNYIVSAVLAPNDTYFGNLWGLNKISAPSAWSISTGSPANIVAVIDTGIDYTQPDLAANVWSAPSAFTVTIAGTTITCPAGSHGYNAITRTCDCMDDNNHGTHVAGTIGAVGNNGKGVVGVNWNTGIMGSKFLDSSGSGYLSDAINAIDFVIQAKSQLGSGANVRVLSNSWGGGGYSQALMDEITKTNAADMLFVVAAGNSASNNDATPTYPANYKVPNVVAVAATDSNDLLASFSNYGPTTVSLGAPGVNILSTVRGGYAYYSGTSMATPHVSGAALLILSKCTLNTVNLKTDILNNVDPVQSLNGKTVTGGRLNVSKAICACSAPPTPTTTTLNASPDSSNYGGSVTFTATISSSAATGRVTFYDGSTVLGTGIVTGGQASFTTSALSVGGHSITATYGGDMSYSSSTSPALPYTVNTGSSSTSLASSPNPSMSGQSVAFTVTVTPSTGTGTVTFNDESTSLGTGTLISGKASFSTSGLSIGSHQITAIYSGDSNVAGNTSPIITQTVNATPPGDFSLSASPSSRSVSRGSSTYYTVSITRVSGFKGSITFVVSGLPSGASGSYSPNPVTGSSSKLTIKTKSTTPRGTYTLTITGVNATLSHATTVLLTVR